MSWHSPPGGEHAANVTAEDGFGVALGRSAR